MKRFQDWPARLNAAIKAKQRDRFYPGLHDCCISACDLVHAMTGVDPAEEIRGYMGVAQMEEVLDERGGVEKIVEDQMRECGNSELESVELAKRGDFVLATLPNGDTAGVVDMDGRYFITSTKRGWVRIPKRHARRAWGIG